MKREVPLLITILAVAVAACGPAAGRGRIDSLPAATTWRFVSEWQPIDLIAVGGGDVWAVTPEGLLRTEVEGGKDWVRLEGLVGEGERLPVRALHADPAGELWIGGEGFLARIASGTATRYASIERILGTVTDIEGYSGTVWAAGGSRIAVHENEQWRILEMPFQIHGLSVQGEVLWALGGEQGVVSIDGESVVEYSDPLGAKDSVPVGVAAAGEDVVVLWAGETAHLSFLRNGAWHAYSVPQAEGHAEALFDVAGEAVLLTTKGLLRVAPRQETGMVPLAALRGPVPAERLSYLIEAEDPDEEGMEPGAPAEAPGRAPLAPTPGPGGDLPASGLVPVGLPIWSPVTDVAGDGEHLAVGTEEMGTFILADWVLAGEIAAYGVEPRTPASKLAMSDGRFLYVLEDDPRAGVVKEGRFSAELVTTDENERLLAFAVQAGVGYAMSLVKEFETVQFFTYREDAFVKVMDRTVDMASGIRDIGDFLVNDDGSFWFTVISDAEGLEMGVAAAYEQYEDLVLHGSVPTPPGLAVAIPNGVSLMEKAPEGGLWLGGIEGVVRLDKDLSATVYREQQGLVGDMVSDLALVDGSVLWALTADGLGWFEGGAWHFPDESPYRGSVIRCIGVDGEGRLVIVDDEAIRRRDGDLWQTVIAREDIPGRDVLDVTEGAGGSLWIVTDRAIAISPPEG